MSPNSIKRTGILTGPDVKVACEKLLRDSSRKGFNLCNESVYHNTGEHADISKGGRLTDKEAA